MTLIPHIHLVAGAFPPLVFKNSLQAAEIAGALFRSGFSVTVHSCGNPVTPGEDTFEDEDLATPPEVSLQCFAAPNLSRLASALSGTGLTSCPYFYWAPYLKKHLKRALSSTPGAVVAIAPPLTVLKTAYGMAKKFNLPFAAIFCNEMDTKTLSGIGQLAKDSLLLGAVSDSQAEAFISLGASEVNVYRTYSGFCSETPRLPLTVNENRIEIIAPLADIKDADLATLGKAVRMILNRRPDLSGTFRIQITGHPSHACSAKIPALEVRDHLEFSGYFGYAAEGEIMTTANLGICCLSNNASGIIPERIWRLIACSVPTIFCGPIKDSRLQKGSEAAFAIIENTSPEILADAILDALENPEHLEQARIELLGKRQDFAYRRYAAAFAVKLSERLLLNENSTNLNQII